MAVSRKAMTEGIRTSIFLRFPMNDALQSLSQPGGCQLPLHKGAFGASLLGFFFSIAKKRTGNKYRFAIFTQKNSSDCR